MYDFINNRMLRTASLPLRVTATGFLLFVLVGAASNLGLLVWKTGLSPTGIERYYRGYEPPPDSMEPIRYPKEAHELLENTHFHIYVVPVVLLILTHLFFMTGWSLRSKVGWTVLAYAAAFADLGAPWLVRYGPEGLGGWKLGTSVVYHGTLLFLTGVCLFEAWRGRPPDPGPL